MEADGGEVAELLDRALQDGQVLMVSAVLNDVLSDPKLASEVSQTLLEVSPGYWQRQASYGRRCLRSTAWRASAMR
jgi:hypothetical protein